jgi:hypothetical protein
MVVKKNKKKKKKKSRINKQLYISERKQKM